MARFPPNCCSVGNHRLLQTICGYTCPVLPACTTLHGACELLGLSINVRLGLGNFISSRHIWDKDISPHIFVPSIFGVHRAPPGPQDFLMLCARCLGASRYRRSSVAWRPCPAPRPMAAQQEHHLWTRPDGLLHASWRPRETHQALPWLPA